MEHQWISFDEGKSIGQKGSEGGKIIRDEENISGARVTLEEKVNIAPFSITSGIYGLMFHTEFFSNFEQAQKCFELYKAQIEQIINHSSIAGPDREESWTAKHNQLITELIGIGYQ